MQHYIALSGQLALEEAIVVRHSLMTISYLRNVSSIRFIPPVKTHLLRSDAFYSASFQTYAISLNLCTGRPPIECDDTRYCIIQF